MQNEDSIDAEQQDEQARSPQRAMPVDPEQMGLNEFYQGSDQTGASLDELSDVYAQLVSAGENPYEGVPEGNSEDEVDATISQVAVPLAVSEEVDSADLTPMSILESMLFVGHPTGEPLVAKSVAGMMRGVTTREIHDLVKDLNATYDEQNSALHIKSVGKGYVLALREEFYGLRERFYGEIREKRLSQAAIDVLAIVAYNQGISRNEIDEMRERPSQSILRELVRREILRLERLDEKPRKSIYYTTERFLDVFGLEHIDDLPQALILDHQW
jgi:segregation and condensation protein B